MNLRFGLAAALFLPLLGCEALIDIEDGGGGSGGESQCGPKPKSGGWCPPAWSCIDGEWQDTAGVCPDPACPEVEPASGDSCQKVSQVCSYANDEPCGPYIETTYDCTATGWQPRYNACQPEPTCPLETPLVGSDCSDWEYPYFCQYNVACLDIVSMVSMSCDYSTDPPLWKADAPAVCSACEVIGDSASCLITEGCQWLVPGCGEGPSVTEGCYRVGDCLVDGCAGGDICTSFEHDPCWNAPCDSCSGQIGMCEAPPPQPD